MSPFAPRKEASQQGLVKGRSRVHELSIASNLVEIVTEAARNAGAKKVIAVHLRLGVLAGIAADSLRFCYDVATANTMLAGSLLIVDHLPVVIHCSKCLRAHTISGVHGFQCPDCGAASADIRQGHELEIASIEIEDAPAE